MRAIAVSGTLVLAAGLGWIGLASAQPLSADKGDKPAAKKEPAKPSEMTLEEMFAAALQNNPDLRMAEAKIREAEAERDRVRLQVMHKVRVLRATLEGQRQSVKALQDMEQMFARLKVGGGSSEFELRQVQKSLADAKTKVAEAEAELPYLLGQGHDGRTQAAHSETCLRFSHTALGVKVTDCMACHRAEQVARGGTGRPGTAANTSEVGWELKPSIRPEMADKIKAALDRPVKLDNAINNAPVADVLDVLQHGSEADKRLSFKADADQQLSIRAAFGAGKAPQVSLPAGTLPLGAWIQMMEDSADLIFVVRDYGILVTFRVGHRDRELPSGAMSATEFWKTYGKQGAAP